MMMQRTGSVVRIICDVCKKSEVISQTVVITDATGQQTELASCCRECWAYLGDRLFQSLTDCQEIIYDEQRFQES